MKNLEHIFLNEAIKSFRGYNKEFDKLLNEVKTFKDLHNAERKLCEKTNFEYSRNNILNNNMNSEPFHINDYVASKNFEQYRNDTLEHPVICENIAQEGIKVLSVSDSYDMVAKFLGTSFRNLILTPLALAVKSIPPIVDGFFSGGVIASFGAVILSIGGAAALYYFIYKLWERFLSKAGQACNKESGKDKTICIKKYQISVVEAILINLRDAGNKCEETDNPGVCRYSIIKETRKWMIKLEKLKRELGKLEHSAEKKSSDTPKSKPKEDYGNKFRLKSTY